MTTQALHIPEELKPKYQRLMRSIPCELRGDRRFEEVALVYLKLGGEKLARQRVEITRKQFEHEFLLVKKRTCEDDVIDAEETETEEDAEI
jgi:hypothetical protein